jgi:hypothetical protein
LPVVFHQGPGADDLFRTHSRRIAVLLSTCTAAEVPAARCRLSRCRQSCLALSATQVRAVPGLRPGDCYGPVCDPPAAFALGTRLGAGGLRGRLSVVATLCCIALRPIGYVYKRTIGRGKMRKTRHRHGNDLSRGRGRFGRPSPVGGRRREAVYEDPQYVRHEGPQ